MHKYSYLAFLVTPLLFMPAFVHAFDFQSAIWSMIVSAFGRFVALFGLLLDYALVNFVIEFAQTFNDGGVGRQVEIAWVSVRDIFNMTFIFGLVYIGFKMILNSDDSTTRKLLINLIMAALLVNFSLFFTKIIVEISNVFATEIARTGFVEDAAGDPSISATFMNLTGLSAIYDVSNAESGPAWGYMLGTMSLFIVSIFVFAAGAFMLIIRYAALLLYMIFSPFMFIGWVFPQLQKYTNQYWSGFLGRAFFAPIYILFVYLALTLIGQFYAQTASTQGVQALGDAFGGSGQVTTNSFAGSLPPFIVSIVLMLAAVVVSSKLSADGSSAAMSLGNKATNWGRRKVQNGVNRIGRVAGQAGRGTLRTATGGRTSRAAIGRSLDKGLNRMQASNSKILRSVGSSNIVDKNIKAASTNLKNTKSIYGGRTLAEDQAYRNKTDARATNQNIARNSRTVINSSSFSDDDKKTAAIQMGTAVRAMSLEEKASLSNKQLTSAEYAKHLTDSEIKSLADSGRIDNEFAEEIKTARNESTFADTFETLSGEIGETETSAKELGEALGTLAKTVKGFSDERVAGLGIKDADGGKGGLTDPRIAMHLTEKQIGSLRESGKFDASQIDQITKAQKSGLTAVTSGDYAGIINQEKIKNIDAEEFESKIANPQREALMNGNVQRVGELPKEVFMSEKMVNQITPQALEQRLKNGGLTAEDRTQIKQNIDILSPEDKKKWVKWSENSTVAMSGGFEFSNQTPTQTTAPQAQINPETGKPYKTKEEAAEELFG